ncbi:MAG: NADH-quinone oxidoreductase subunit NuoK [Bacteroidota bacterium]
MSLEPTILSYLAVSVIMFVLGAVGVMIRRNAIVVFMCVELMLNAVNLSLVAFSKMHYVKAQLLSESSEHVAPGSMLVFFVMCVAAAEAVVGLSIIISLFRNRLDIDINNMNIFKW